MGLIATLAQTFLRAYVVDGVPASGVNDPAKSDGLAAFNQVDAAVSSLASFSAIGVAYATQALLFADLVHAAGVIGLVYNDATAANNGFYVKSGASGAGAWTITGISVPTALAQVSQLQAALQAAGVLQTVINAIPADPASPINQQWTSGGLCTQAGPLGAAIKIALGYTTLQMTTLFASAFAQAY